MLRQETSQPTMTTAAPLQGATLWRSVLLGLVLGLMLTARPVAAAPSGPSTPSAGAACSDGEAGATQRLAASIETFNKVVTLFERVTDHHFDAPIKMPLTFAPALLKDLAMARAQGGHLNPLTSHTLERLGTFGLKTLPTVVERLKDAGKLPASFKVVPTTFGLEEFVAGGAAQLGRGRLGIDEITHYLDGVSKATAAVAGALVAGPRGAKIGESAAALAQDVFRGLTMPIFHEMANRPVRQRLIADWHALQDSQIARGQPMQRFSQLYPRAELRQLGFHTKTVSDLDRYADWANATKGGRDLRAVLPARQALTPHAPHGLPPRTGPGGICLGGQRTYQVNPDLHQDIESLARDAVESADDPPRALRQP